LADGFGVVEHCLQATASSTATSVPSLRVRIRKSVMFISVRSLSSGGAPPPRVAPSSPIARRVHEPLSEQSCPWSECWSAASCTMQGGHGPHSVRVERPTATKSGPATHQALCGRVDCRTTCSSPTRRGA
jgi:hypothetical protein